MRLDALRRPVVWVPLAGAVALAAWVAPRLYVADLQDALVREANEIVAAPRTRTLHVDAARAGSFADALRGPLQRYDQGWKVLAGTDGARALVSAVARGERPLADLPANVASGLSPLAADLDALLAASRSERADLGPDHDPFGPFREASWVGLQQAAKHVAIRIRATGASDPDRALSDCLDGLALGRDAAVAGGLVGRMTRAGIVGLLTTSCAEAISGADVGAARAAGPRLRRIRDAAPSFGAMLREEAIQVQLLAYGPRLPSKERLLARPRAFADDGAMAPGGVLGPLRARLAWRDLRDFQERLVEVAMLPAPERDAAFAELGHAPLLLRLLFGNLDGPEPVEAYATYSRRDAAAELRLDLLVAAAGARELRERQGRWPRSVAELASGGALTPEEAGRLSRLVLDEQQPADALRLVLPVPQPDPDARGEVVVWVSRPGGAPRE
jgi:hypothetical protein